MWSELYSEIAEKIKANIDRIRWIDLWHEQVGYLTEEEFLSEENLRAWKDLNTIIGIESSREINGAVAEQTRFYIDDEEFGYVFYYSQSTRDH